MATAVFGCGTWGRNIIRDLKDELAVIYDANQGSLDSLADDYSHIPKVSSLDKVWQIPTVKRVAVATPAATHYELANEALMRGMDVFVEKPLTTSLAEAEELNALAKSKGCVLMVGHLLNYCPAVEMLSDWITSNRFGSLRKIQTRQCGLGSIHRDDVDVMQDLGVHVVSVSLRLFENGGFELDESSIKATYSKTIGLHSDTVFAQGKFTNKLEGKQVLLEIYASWHHSKKESFMQFVFEDCIINWDTMTSLNDETAITMCELRPSVSNARFVKEYVAKLTRESGPSLPLERELLHFLYCCNDRSTPRTDGVEGIRVAKFLNLVSRCGEETSAETGAESLNVAAITETSSKDIDKKLDKDKTFIHPLAFVEDGAKIGKGTRVWRYSHLTYNCLLGDYCSIGQNCAIGHRVILGNGVRLQNNTGIAEGCVCEDDVFLGYGVVIANDKSPRSGHRPEKYKKTLIKRGASIGSGSTIVGGITLGEYCLVGAGSVVTKDVKPYALVYGNPARQNGWLDKEGRIHKERPDVPPPPFIPTYTNGNEWKIIEKDVKCRLDKVFREGRLINGPEVSEIEKQLAEFVDVPHCIAVGSGTDALQLALMAKMVSNGDEVIVPTFTFIATAEVVALLGAVPVFVDILPDTYNIDPRALEKAISSKTKAIIAVSLFGEVADLEEIRHILTKLRRNDVVLIEDAAQSFGAKRGSLKSCGYAEISCTSFYPTKPFGCYGDGGAVFTKDESTAVTIRQIASHGQSGLYRHESVGVNSRLDTVQAAILLSKMNIFSNSILSRQRVAQIYHDYLEFEEQLILPSLNDASVYAQYTIQVDDRIGRDRLQAVLEKAGVKTRVYYPTPLHLQPVFQKTTCITTPCPVAESVSKKVLSLPMYPFMREVDAVTVASAVQKAVAVTLSKL